MTGLRLTVVNAGPLNPDKNKLVAFASAGTVSVPTTVGIIEHPQHGLILWDTGINDAVADPDRGEAYWGPGIREAFGTQALTRDHAIDAQLKRLGLRPEDVRYVIYSHLHLDHAGGMSYFPKAIHVVQRDEIPTHYGQMHGRDQCTARMTSRTSVRSMYWRSRGTTICSMTVHCAYSRHRGMQPGIRR